MPQLTDIPLQLRERYEPEEFKDWLMMQPLDALGKKQLMTLYARLFFKRWAAEDFDEAGANG